MQFFEFLHEQLTSNNKQADLLEARLKGMVSPRQASGKEVMGDDINL
jgi:hypothetical protein